MQYFSFFRRPVCLIFSGMVSGIALFLLLFSSFSFADMGNEDEGIPQEDNEIMNAVPTNVANPSCIDNYMDWPESEEYHPDEWGLQLIPSSYQEPNVRREEPYPFRQFLDVNNDGIMDFFYMTKGGAGWNGTPFQWTEECLLLGTGNGWDLAHKCVVKRGHENQPTRFYGDCASVE